MLRSRRSVTAQHIGDTVGDLEAQVKALTELLDGYWIEARADGDYLVAQPTIDNAGVDDYIGDGAMLVDVVRLAIWWALRDRVVG